MSAHFEFDNSGFEISNAANPRRLHVIYPIKGDSGSTQKVEEQHEKNKIKANLVDRGFDHGVFVLIRPQSGIPIVTMSINSILGNEAYFDLGKVLAPFRDEDTLILCSGQPIYNATRPIPALIEEARASQSWLDDRFPRSPI